MFHIKSPPECSVVCLIIPKDAVNAGRSYVIQRGMGPKEDVICVQVN